MQVYIYTLLHLHITFHSTNSTLGILVQFCQRNDNSRTCASYVVTCVTKFVSSPPHTPLITFSFPCICQLFVERFSTVLIPNAPVAVAGRLKFMGLIIDKGRARRSKILKSNNSVVGRDGKQRSFSKRKERNETRLKCARAD